MITKPAGVGLQLLGALCLFGGLIALAGSLLAGSVLIGLGAWLLMIGRRPSSARES